MAATWRHAIVILAERDISDEDLRAVREFAHAILERPIELLDGVAETVAELSERHDLVIFTKGDPEEQQAKIDRSGLAAYFRHAVIAKEKNVPAYLDLAKQHGLLPAETLDDRQLAEIGYQSFARRRVGRGLCAASANLGPGAGRRAARPSTAGQNRKDHRTDGLFLERKTGKPGKSARVPRRHRDIEPSKCISRRATSCRLNHGPNWAGGSIRIWLIVPISGVWTQRRLNLFLRSPLGLSRRTRSNTLIESRIAILAMPNHPVDIQIPLSPEILYTVATLVCRTGRGSRLLPTSCSISIIFVDWFHENTCLAIH